MNKRFIDSVGILLLALLFVSGSTACKKKNQEEKLEVRSPYEDIEEVIGKWNESLNLRDGNMSEGVFGSTVNFYGTDMSGKDASDRRIAKTVEDPTWNQEIISDIDYTDLADGSVKAYFTKKSTDSKGTKTYRAYLVLENQNGEWKVVKESDDLTDKNLQKKKSAPKETEVTANDDTPAVKEKSRTERVTYKGNIGPYGVKVSLTLYNETVQQGFGTLFDVKGSYTYTEAGNTLNLKGTTWTMDGTHLEEYTPKGNHSASWHLDGFVGDDVLTGDFQNLNNGNVFNVYLKRTN